VSTQTYYGAIPDSFSIDSDGGTNYCIPIELPPGTAKMQPTISIGYNSGGPNGLLGVGWQLLGLSSVSRVEATIAQDGFHGAINYDANDRFALDGLRLILVEGSAYAAADAVYRTEIESWRKVVPQYPNGDTSNGPQSFLVYTHDGTVLEYGGGTGGSVYASNNPGIVRFWSLTKATDRNGNYLTAQYDYEAGDSNNYPLSVDYTANDVAGLTAQRSVQFNYQSRTDIVPQYEGGGMWQTSKLLANIQTFVSSSLVRTYSLAYASGNATGRTQLQSVTLSDNQGNYLPATSFGWQDTLSGVFQAPSSAVPTTFNWSGSYYAADLNGDGYVDLLNVSESGGKIQFTAWFSDNSTFSPAAGVPVPTSVSYHSDGQFLLMDVNGDGAMDVVYASESSGQLALTVFISSGSGSGWTLTAGAPGAAGPGNIPYGNVYALDVDGDGLTDLVCTGQNSSGILTLTTLFSNGTTFAKSSDDQTDPTKPFFSASRIVPLDSSGNGLTDLLYAYPVTNVNDVTTMEFVLYVSQGRSGFVEQQSVISSGSTTPVGVFMASDFNGDGIDDVVQAYTDNGKLTIQTIVANGRSMTIPSSQSFDVGDFGEGFPVLLPMEVNGDGLPDLVCLVKSGSDLIVTVLLANGTGYTKAQNVPTISGIAAGLGIPPILPMDFNGDGRTDLVAVTESGDKLQITPIACQMPFADLLCTITNGLGGKYTLGYKPLTDATVYSETGSGLANSVEVRGIFSTRVSGASYQVSNASPTLLTAGSAYTTRRVDFPKNVVAGYVKSYGRGNSSYTQFYESALMDLTGRGWLGFASIAAIDPNTDTINLTAYHQIFPLSHNVASTTLIRSTNGVPSFLMQQTAFSWNPVISVPNCDVYQVLQTTVQTDYFTYAPLNGGTPDCTLIKTSSNFDAFGNPQLISQTGSALANDLWVFKQYQNDPVNWRIGFEVSSKSTADGAGDVVLSWQEILYDASMNVQTSSIWHDQTQRFLTTTYTYDDCANPLTITNPAGGVTTLTYEPTYMTFLLTKSVVGANNVALTTKAEYFPSNGEMQTFTDENGVITSQTVDGLGQITGKTGPSPSGGTIQGLTQSWGTDETGIYIQVVSLLDWKGTTTWQKQYLDGFARTFRSVSPAADGVTPIFTDQEFDSRNNVIMQSYPYFEGASPAQYNNITYDFYNRVKLLTEPSPVDDGSTLVTTLSWENTNTVMVTQAFNTADAVTTTYDYVICQGKQVLVKRTDSSGASTSYSCDALGRLTTIVDPAGVISTTSYDTMGRPTSFAAQNGSVTLRSIQITYDDVKGTIVSQDAKGNVITLQSDNMGRLLSRSILSADTSSTETISFVYDSPQATLSQSRLSAASSTSGAVYHFGYDAYGNQAEITLALDGLSWAFQQTYTPTGQLESRAYPDGSVETHAYLANGLSDTISLAASAAAPAAALITFASYNSVGKPVTISYANGVSEQIGFAACGQAKTMSIAAPNQTLLYAAALQKNNLGAASGILETVANLQISYGYDTQQRLATVSESSGDSYQYDTAGNITLKGGVTWSGAGNQTTTGTENGATVFSAAFDKAGNVSSMIRGGAATTYIYDGENRLVDAQTTTFLYDYSGRRIRKQVQNGPCVYSVSPNYQVVLFPDGSEQHSKLLCGKTGAAVTVTTVDKGSPAAYKGLAAPGVFYNHTDQLGSIIRQTDDNGNVVASAAYDAYGALTLSGSISLPAMFTGKEWDDSTGLYYFGARYYDPVSGRFLTADDRTGGALADRDVMNPYAYCLNDPINYVDPSGHSITKDFRSGAGDVKHGFDKFGSGVVHLVHNRVFQLTFSYTVDGLLIVGGSVLLFLGFGTAGTSLLSAGVMGMVYDIQITARHQSFSWASWGIQLLVGGVTGAIAGGASFGASAIADSLADGGAVSATGNVGESIFDVGRAGRVGLNIAAGALGGGAGNVAGQLITNAFAHQKLTAGLGFAAVSGFVIGGVGSAIGEGTTHALSREPNEFDIEAWRSNENDRWWSEPSKEVKHFPWQRMVQDNPGAKFVLFLPGYVADWAGFGVSATAVFKASWLPSW
jgi:RHS repeat-associated protein